jgi:outer membrane protein OmpA-like peptidoglycan-associated protein
MTAAVLLPGVLSALGLAMMIEAARQIEVGLREATPSAPPIETIPSAPPPSSPQPERAAEPAPPPPPALSCPSLPDLRFARGISNLTSESTSALAGLARWLAEHPEISVGIDGRADGLGSEDSNLLLSHRRAQSVAEVLVAQGVARGRLTVRSLGAPPNDPSKGESPKQRRADLVLSAPDLHCSTSESP